MIRLKSFFFAVLAALLSVPGCDGSDSSCIEGQGPLVSRTLELASFEGIDFQVAGKVSISQGDEQLVEVRARENMIDLLNTDILQGVWGIGFRECVRDTGPVEVTITVPTLDSVALSGSGDIIAELSTEAMATILSGTGNIELSGISPDHAITFSGSGQINAFELMTERTAITLSGSGNVEVSASEELGVVLSGVGDVFYKGNPVLEVTVSGVGKVIDAN